MSHYVSVTGLNVTTLLVAVHFARNTHCTTLRVTTKTKPLNKIVFRYKTNLNRTLLNEYIFYQLKNMTFGVLGP